MSKISKNTVLGVLPAIDQEPKLFFKKLAKFYRQECLFTILIPQWAKEEELWIWDDIQAKTKDLPTQIKIANIVNCLKQYYGFDSYEYKNDTFVDIAIKLNKKYQDRIVRYMDKKFHPDAVRLKSPDGVKGLPFHTPVEAFRELVSRGFIPLNLVPAFDPKKDVYVQGNFGSGLVYPHEKFKYQMEAYELLRNIGVTGYTGIHNIKHG